MLPDTVYHVNRRSDKAKPYYGRRDVRIYGGKQGVAAFLSANTPKDTFEVHALEPGEDWKDVTQEFLCSHIIMVCNVCGVEYDNDFSPPAMCHFGDRDWSVRAEQRYKCRIHRR